MSVISTSTITSEQFNGSISVSTGNITTTCPNTIYSDKKYSTQICGFWEKQENDCLEDKEENKEEFKMLEGKDLIKHIFRERKEVINEYYDKLVKEANDNDTIISEFDSIKDGFKKQMDDLYDKYAKREIEEKIENPFVRTGVTIFGMQIECGYQAEGVKEINKEREEALSELDKQASLVMSATGIAQNKQEIEEILTRYGLLDKNGVAITTCEIKTKENTKSKKKGK